jgi:RNA polymerase sigma-70 factor (ECF subfamily)
LSASTHASDEELLERSRAGDEAAFTALYRRRQGALFRFALRMSGQAAIADDVVQEVFMVLIGSGCRYEPAQGPLSAFLYGVARNHVRRQLEKVGRLVPLEDPEADDGAAAPHESWQPDLYLARLESASAVRAAVLALPEAYREVVVLVELEGLSYAEAAAALECALGTVRSRLHRARLTLAKTLRDAVESVGPRAAARRSR